MEEGASKPMFTNTGWAPLATRGASNPKTLTNCFQGLQTASRLGPLSRPRPFASRKSAVSV